MDRGTNPAARSRASSSVLAVRAGRSAAIGGYVGWYKFFREEPQPDWVTATPEMRFKYGSHRRGERRRHPVLDLLRAAADVPREAAGPGGYASLGVPWEQGQELPVGFTKKTIGFPRVANNCAVCHTATYRTKPDENPTFVVAGPGPHHQRRSLLPLPGRLRQGSALQRRQPDARDQAGHRPVAGSTSLLYRFLADPDHQEAAARARGAVRVDLPQGFSRLGPRPRRRHEPDQVLHDQGCRWTTPSARPTCRRSGTCKKYKPEQGHAHELGRRQPRRVLGDHRFRARPARRAAARQAGISRTGRRGCTTT